MTQPSPPAPDRLPEDQLPDNLRPDNLRPEQPRPDPAPAPKPVHYSIERSVLEKEVELSFVRGSGPGGQHRNKVETGVRLHHPPSGITVVATSERSQTRNRETAFERLIEKLKVLNHKPRRRKKTRKPRSANRKRLEAKKRNSERKQGRRNPHD